MARPAGSAGPFSALRNIFSTLLATGQTRLELLSNEIQTEKRRALQQLSLTLCLAFCLGTALLLAIVLLLVLFWEQRVVLLVVLILLFLGLGGFLYRALRRAGASAEPLFSASLAELREDLRQLKAAAGDAQEPR